MTEQDIVIELRKLGYTFDKLLRRVYAVMDLAEAGLIVDHYTSIYHNQNTTCAECS